MSEKRQDFLQNHDWIRQGLMFEPRGHDMMSGSFLYPPCSENADASILFIETSGCLPCVVTQLLVPLQRLLKMV